MFFFWLGLIILLICLAGHNPKLFKEKGQSICSIRKRSGYIWREWDSPLNYMSNHHLYPSKKPVHLLLMEEIPKNHLGCIKPCKYWDIYHINWCRISEPSTVLDGLFLWTAGIDIIHTTTSQRSSTRRPRGYANDSREDFEVGWCGPTSFGWSHELPGGVATWQVLHVYIYICI